jgi:lysophospholipase L1-like esterase
VTRHLRLAALAALPGLLACSPSSGDRATPGPVGDAWVFVGDSITAQGWFWSAQSQLGATGLLVDQLTSAYTSQTGTTVSSAAANAAPGVVDVVTPVGKERIYPINSGVAHNRIADLDADAAARVTRYDPKLVVVEVGINDIMGGTGTSAFRASYDSFLGKVATESPIAAIVCLSVVLWGEQWTPGPPLAWNNGVASYDTIIPGYNDEIEGSCVAHGGTYVDVYGPMLTAESIQNTPAPGLPQGVLTLDHIHPTAAGQLIMSDAVRLAIN